jgi:hypothetical protein
VTASVTRVHPGANGPTRAGDHTGGTLVPQPEAAAADPARRRPAPTVRGVNENQENQQ